MRASFSLVVALALFACVPPQQPGDPNMSGTYTATPDAVISGGAVAATVPSDGDLASVASILASVEKSLNVNKKLINQALLAGLTPSILDVNATNGLLYASELTSSVRARIYARGAGHDREIVLTINASWNGTVWTRDTNLQDAVLFGLMGPSGLLATSGYIHALQFDTTTAATWTDSGWNASILSTNGTPAGAGVGVIELAALVTPAYSGTWGDAGGGYQGLRVYKNPFGEAKLSGSMKNASTGNLAITTLSAAYRSSVPKFWVVRVPNGSGFDDVEITLSTAGVLSAIGYATSNSQLCLDGLPTYR